MATTTLGTRALPEPTPAASVPAAAAPKSRQRELDGVGFFAKFVAIGFWGTVAAVFVGAAVTGVALFLLPLLGLGYLVFCLIALTGERNAE